MPQLELSKEGRDSLLQFLSALVQTPSPSGKESGVAALVMDEMRRLGYDEVWIDAAGNVLGRIGSPSGPVLMLDSHMDTVDVADPQAWSVDPYGAVVIDGQLYGVGACDMKGGLAASVYGAALLGGLRERLSGSILVACVGLEEPSEGTCTRACIEELGIRPDWVVIPEPSNLHVVRAQRGHLEMVLTVKGRSAHSSTPELGINAVYAAARVIFGLEILAGQLMTDPFLGPGVLAVTEITSHGASRNALPDRCELFLDRRLTVGETEAMSLLEVQRVIAREGVDAAVRVLEHDITTHTGKTLHARRTSLPWALEERHPLVQAMLQAARSVGLRPTMTCWPYATEGAYTAGVARIPTVGFGPGDPGLLHRSNEHVDVNQVYAAANAYAALAGKLLGATNE